MHELWLSLNKHLSYCHNDMLTTKVCIFYLWAPVKPSVKIPVQLFWQPHAAGATQILRSGKRVRCTHPPTWFTQQNLFLSLLHTYCRRIWEKWTMAGEYLHLQTMQTTFSIKTMQWMLSKNGLFSSGPKIILLN